MAGELTIKVWKPGQMTGAYAFDATRFESGRWSRNSEWLETRVRVEYNGHLTDVTYNQMPVFASKKTRDQIQELARAPGFHWSDIEVTFDTWIPFYGYS